MSAQFRSYRQRVVFGVVAADDTVEYWIDAMQPKRHNGIHVRYTPANEQSHQPWDMD